MYVYCYHCNSKRFIGVAKALLSPLDRKWILPSNCTVIPCPDEPLEENYYYEWCEEQKKWITVYEQPAVATESEAFLDPPEMESIIEETVAEALGTTETNPAV